MKPCAFYTKTRFVLLVATLLVASTGCTSLMKGKMGEPQETIDTRAMRLAGYNFDERGAQRTLPANDGKPAVVLEVRDGKRHLERIPLPPDKPTFIHDIVVDAKLVEKVGRIRIQILRPTSGANPPIRMDVDMDDSGKSVVKWQNYALQPGDQIVVSKDDRSWLDGFTKSLRSGRS